MSAEDFLADRMETPVSEATGEKVQEAVRVHRHGVYVGGRCVARGLDTYNAALEARVLAVRERTSPEWWRIAAVIQEASEAYGTGGPLGLGVDFFAGDGGDAIPDDVRWEIQQDAYEAAREVIVQGIEDHLRRMAPAVVAASHLGSSTQEGSA